MKQKPDKLLLIALIVGVIFHGTIFFFTFSQTYDAFVHIFFADHYARSWFEPWDNRWYTGFNVTSYPPLVHQLTALISKIVGLKNAFVFLAMGIISLLIVGSYRFAKLWTTPRAAGYAAIFTCFSTSIMEALHLFGQLPTLMGMACLLNALPEIYRWIRYGKKYRLATAISIMAVGVTSHHVTTIFGMVFFVAPVMGLAVMDALILKLENKPKDISTKPFDFKLAKDDTYGLKTMHWKKDIYESLNKVGVSNFLSETYKKRWRLIIFCLLIPVIMMLVFPYFYWSKTDPISQVSIPHGSRDSFIDVPSSGLMFFLIPMGVLLLLLPYIFTRVWKKRNIFIGLSFSLLVLLGTGGTTPIPKLMLGETAFNILTLDRFTFWATIISIPFVGEFFYRLVEGDFRDYFRKTVGFWPHRLMWTFLVGVVGALTILVINLGTFRPLQPDTIDIKPITQFLERDQHDKWRFITLGFGDQMAWLSAQTEAQSVDGNYHSARRLPEMTTRPLERLENSKFKGVQGLGSLQQFLTVPEKYYLKFIFSNDKFYDPILYYAGWERVQRLENGIMVWQKQDVPPLPSVLPKKDLPRAMKLMWAILPLFALLAAFIINFVLVYYTRFKNIELGEDGYKNTTPELPFLKTIEFKVLGIWCFVVTSIIVTVSLMNIWKEPNSTPKDAVISFYNAIDFKYFKEAYNFFDPRTRPSFDEYFIKLSVEDGIVASYAKLDNIQIDLTKVNDSTYTAIVDNEWITPVQQYMTQNEHTLRKYKGKWYLDAPEFDISIPPDNFIQSKTLQYHNHGKRRATSEATMHADILDRPELNILNAKLVKYEGRYSVIGEVQNIDNLPSHITLKAELFDKYDRKLVTYNAKYNTIHRIAPKEIIPFRIDFEATAWVTEEDLDPASFNPGEFTEVEFQLKPSSFKLFARAVFDNNDIYRDVGVQRVQYANEKIKGEALNYGTEEISIPKLLISYYDEQQSLYWVDSQFIREGIRPQRKRKFDVSWIKNDSVKILKKARDQDLFVNGLPNTSYLVKDHSGKRVSLMEADGLFYDIRIDAYIGNPTIY